jgi:hypothetical protein
MILDVSGTQTIDLQALNAGANLFGDASQKLMAWVMHSKSQADIYGTSLANTNNLFTFGTVSVIQDGYGRPIIVTDSPDLHYTDGPEKYLTLGLTDEALTVEANNDFRQTTETTTGQSNITDTIQSEWSSNYGVKGYSWDKASGGKAPNDAEIRTGTNWPKYVSSDKNTAGVLIKSL